MITQFETDRDEKFEVNEFAKLARPAGGDWAPYTSLSAVAGQRAFIAWTQAAPFVSAGHVTWVKS